MKIHRSQFFVFVLDLRRLEHSWYTCCRFPLLLGFPLCFQLLLFEIKLRVITRKFFQLNEEVTSSKLELVDVTMMFAEEKNEGLDLNPGSRTKYW